MGTTEQTRLKPEEFLEELDKMAYGVGDLRVMTSSQWKSIVDAYDSPLIRRIADRMLRVIPLRAIGTKELSFTVFWGEKNESQ